MLYSLFYMQALYRVANVVGRDLCLIIEIYLELERSRKIFEILVQYLKRLGYEMEWIFLIPTSTVDRGLNKGRGNFLNFSDGLP